jgi:hypothetical protein
MQQHFHINTYAQHSNTNEQQYHSAIAIIGPQ